ncbi:MAG: 2-dehydropantoate 2-reductase [Desulforhopalus sp.]|jgi:2-dehydropantoate 2-reductase
MGVNMKIVIVGGGAIGRLFGSFLLRGSNELTMIDNDLETLGALQARGIGLILNNSDAMSASQDFPVKALESASSLTSAELVLLLVKSQSTLSAVKDVAHLIGDDCPLLSIQTGLGNLETASKVVDPSNILLGITFMSATALSDAKVRQGGLAKTYIGELSGLISPRLEAIGSVFNRSGMETQLVRRIMGRLWCKVITYSALNPVSAILQVPNGSLTTNMESVTLMKRLLDEGRAVADLCSIELVYPDLYQLLFNVCENSANNLSSMLQDVLNEVPTEIEAQNGALCYHAHEHGLPVPTQQTMVEMIKLLERWRPRMEQP